MLSIIIILLLLQQLIPIYNSVYKNKTNVVLNEVNCLCHKLNDTNSQLDRTKICFFSVIENRQTLAVTYNYVLVNIFCLNTHTIAVLCISKRLYNPDRHQIFVVKHGFLQVNTISYIHSRYQCIPS